MVECGGLENRFTRNPGNEGSNPSSSASAKHEVRRLSVWPFRFWYICWHAKRHGFGENASNAGSAIGKDAKHPTTGGRATGQERERETETRGAGASRHWRGRTRQDGKQGAGARGQARPRPHQQALAAQCVAQHGVKGVKLSACKPGISDEELKRLFQPEEPKQQCVTVQLEVPASLQQEFLHMAQHWLKERVGAP